MSLPGEAWLDASDEELARAWTLNDDDLAEVLSCRGDAHRRRFAVQLCMLRRHGRFLSDYDEVPIRVLNHLSAQLNLHPILFLEPAERDGTESDQKRRIQDYLGFADFDTAAKERLAQWLSENAGKESTIEALRARTVAQLFTWKIVPPPRGTLQDLLQGAISDSRSNVYDRIHRRLPEEVYEALDHVLDVGKDGRSQLFHLQAYPPAATLTVIEEYFDYYRLVRDLNLPPLAGDGVTPQQVDQLAALARHYDAAALRRFEDRKRRVLLVCLLSEAKKTLLDHLVRMHKDFMTKKTGEAEEAFEVRQREYRRRLRQSELTFLHVGETLLKTDQPLEERVQSLENVVEDGSLSDAVAALRLKQLLDRRGPLQEMSTAFPALRRYLPDFLSLPFEAKPGNEPVLAALRIARQFYDGTLKKLPKDLPTEFLPPAWHKVVNTEDGVDARYWQMGLADVVGDRLRSGDLFLSGSGRHLDFWKFLYDDAEWAKERPRLYAELAQHATGQAAVAALKRRFDAVALATERGLGKNSFARIVGGKLKLSRDKGLKEPPEVEQLRQVLAAHTPHIRIEVMLQLIDALCNFTGAFKPLPGYEPRTQPSREALLAALLAQGTNLGITAMGNSTEGMSTATLQQAMEFIRPDTIKEALARLVNFHHELEESSVYGNGETASSDGQRFALRRSSLLGGYYPRHFGYYDPVVSIYTHISDQCAVFHTRAISCGEREASYVLDGLEDHHTLLRPKEHYTDTHGYTEHMFGLCYLLGYDFMPRIKKLHKQQLYRMDKTSYGRLDALWRSQVDTDLIVEQWDDLIRLAASLRHGSKPPHVLVQRLAGSGPSNRLAKALTALGRIVKTVFVLRYIHDEELRRRIERQLNRGEHRHSLARHIFFGRSGEFQVGDFEEIMNKSSCLSLLCNVVMVWNTLHHAKVVASLREQGQTVLDEHLSHIWPLAFSHVLVNGTYSFASAPKSGVDIAYNMLP